MRLRKNYLLIIVLLITINITAQVGIGTVTPDESAILDLAADDKGLLIPRLTDGEVTNIDDPAQGLLVFNKTFAKFQYYDGFTWLDIKVNTGISDNIMITNTEGDVSVTTEENIVEKRISMVAAFEHVMSIDTAVANIAPPLTLGDNPYTAATARLDVDGRLKISDDNIAAPQAGMIRWSNDTQDFEGYDGMEWKSMTQSSSISYGSVTPQAYPSSTILPKQDRLKHEYARLHISPEKMAHTAYDTVVQETRITIEQPNSSTLLWIPESSSAPTSHRLGLSENWATYQTGNTIKTWKYVSGYFAQEELSLGLGGGSHRLIGDGRIVTSRPDASWTTIDLNVFNEDSNQWQTSDTELVLQSPVEIHANNDTLVTSYYTQGKITTYDLSSNSFTEMSEYYFPGNIRDVLYRDHKVIVAETNFNNNTIAKVSFRDVADLELLELEIPITEEMWGLTPKITLAYENGLLAVGIRNARNEQGVKCGKVLLYEITTGSATKIAELLPGQAQTDMQFGRDIVINGDDILVTAPYFDYDGSSDSGILFTYSRNP